MFCSVCKEKHVIKITDNNNTTPYCLNCLLSAVINHKLKIKNNPDFIDDVTGEKGAVKFENKDEIYVLEKERMYRLITHSLEPDEYFALAQKYGADKFEIHSDFYDDFDGVAIQPVEY